MKRSEMINEISKAMANAQGEMEPALKSSKNPFYKSNYADLAAIMESIKVPLKKNDLSVWQDVITNEKGISVCTMVSHSSGQWIEFGPLEIALAKRDAQSVGSAITYAKRYALSAAVGVVSDNDDDGEAAMGRNATKTVQYKVDAKMMQHKQPMDHIEESLEMIENAHKEEDPIKYISKSQLKMFNEKYDLVTEQTRDMIDQAIIGLEIEGFPSIEKMQEKDWMRFMKSFEKFFEKKKS
jgi:hypothetical protein